MANVLVEESYLQDIANAIRTKNGSNDTYTPAEMATAIEDITTGGGSWFDVKKFLQGTLTSINDENGEVTSICANAFRDLRLSSTDGFGNGTIDISFPNVTSIGHHAFYTTDSYKDYSPWKSFYFPECTTINYSTFCNTKNCTSIIIPKLQTINGMWNFGNSGILNIDLPLVQTITESCFRGCSSLQTVNLPLVKNIAAYAFDQSTSLTSLNFPELISLAGSSFNGCSSLQYISMPKFNGAFSGGTFSNCRNLKEIYAPNSTGISDYGALNNCSSLEKVTFGFNSWNNYNAVLIPIKEIVLTKITQCGNPFSGCTNLEKLVIEQSNSVCTVNTSGFLNNTKIGNGTGYIYVPDTLVSSYQNATNWSTYASQIKGLSELPQD